MAYINRYNRTCDASKSLKYYLSTCLYFYDPSKNLTEIFLSTFFRGSPSVETSRPPQTCWTRVITLFGRLLTPFNYICACVRSACPAATRCGSGFINTMTRTAVACWTQATILFGALGRYRYSDFFSKRVHSNLHILSSNYNIYN